MSKRELWSGRFRKQLDPAAKLFSSSPEDSALFGYDIAGSIAHALGLRHSGILSAAECSSIVEGLRSIYRSGRGKEDSFLSGSEDIHMAVEAELTRIEPDSGSKLHTGRSRNDQIALDLKLYCREAVVEIVSSLTELSRLLLKAARKNMRSVLPGYTHMQHAQPLYLSQHLLAHHWRLMRDIRRLQGFFEYLNVSPLGAGAIGGSSLPIDPAYTSKLLAFTKPFHNSLEATSDRDFVLDVVYASSIIALHLSSLSEEVVLWSSSEFNFVTLPENLATGSSLMPHKKNPDVAELIRGRTGRLAGNMVSLMMTAKALPLGYSRDLQETKKPLFSSVDSILDDLNMMKALMAGIRFNTKAMKEAASDQLSYSVEAVDELVRNGMPFREAHRIIGEKVAESLESGDEFSGLLKHKWPHMDFPSNAGESVEKRSSPGASSLRSIKRQLEASDSEYAQLRSWLRRAGRLTASVSKLLGS